MGLFDRHKQLEAENERLRRENRSLNVNVQLLSQDVAKAIHERRVIRSRCKPGAEEAFDNGCYGLLHIDLLKNNGFKIQVEDYCQYCNEFEPVVETLDCSTAEETRYIRTIRCEHAQRCIALKEKINEKDTNTV